MLFFKDALVLIRQYKFSILTFLGIWFLIAYPGSNYLSVPFVLSALCIMCIIRIISLFRFFYVLTFLLTIILSANAVVCVLYQGYFTFGIFASIMETNTNEASGAFKNLAIVSGTLLVITNLLIILSCKELRKSKLSKIKPLIYIAVYLLIFLPLLSYIYIEKNNLQENFRNRPMLAMQRTTMDYAPVLFGNIMVALSYYEDVNLLKEMSLMHKNRISGLSDGDNSLKTPDKIYIILGESSNPKHYSLYGYNIETTPFLDSLKNNTNMLAVYEAYTGAPFTRVSIPMIMSFGHPRNFDFGFKTKATLKLAAEKGYSTYWISNQTNINLPDSIPAIDQISYIASDAQHKMYATKAFSNDLNLIPLLKEIHNKEQKQVIVLHIAGSHIYYKDRVDQEDIKALPDNPLNKTLAYDRTIYHTDRVLKEVFKVMDTDDSAILYYLSDHGEVVNKGHGWGNLKDGVEQYKIPLLTINKSAFPMDSIMSRYIDPQSEHITSTSTSYIISETLGYSVSDSLRSVAIDNGRYTIFTDRVMKLMDLAKYNDRLKKQ